MCSASSGNLKLCIEDNEGSKKLFADVLYALAVLERHDVVVFVGAANTRKARFFVLDKCSVEHPDK